MDQRAQKIQDAIEAIAAISDPQERALVIGQALDVFKTGNATLSRLRRDDVQALRSTGLSFGQIGDALGIHRSRVKQIESGAATGATARARQQRAEEKAEDA